MRRALYLALLLGGCAQILDLKDRELAENLDSGTPGVDAGTDTSTPTSNDGATTDAGKPPTCEEYCELAERNCTKEAGAELFQERGICLAVCSKYSKAPSITGNTLACRLEKLRDLANIGSNEALTTCPAAGPGGGPPPNEPSGVNCGTNCEGFCALRMATCPLMNGDIDCVNRCKGLIDDDIYNADADFRSGKDTLSCRIAHLSAAAYYDAQGKEGDRTAHCSHSGIRSEQQCDYPSTDPPECDSYCKIVALSCTGDARIYENDQQCMKVCAAFNLQGDAKNKTVKGSRRCMRSGSYDALEGLANGCQRASLAGDGCLGGRCQSYCYFAKQACPDLYAQQYASDEDCETKCNGLQDAQQNAPYAYFSQEAQAGRSLQCRLRRLTLLLEGRDIPANTCPAALGLAGSICAQ